MRVAIQILCFVAVLTNSIGSPIPDEPVIDLAALARMTPEELDDLAGGLAAEELIRTKRSGSGDILQSVSKKLSSGLNSKFGLIASASAGATSLITSASSKSGGHSEHHGYSYGPPPPPVGKGFDFWSLKKSILNTLFQAVKAITGGVTIINGQLIKGGGALASSVGKLISIKGDAVTNLGRHIVSSATLVPPKKKPIIHVPAPIHISAPGPIHHSIPSGPSLTLTTSYTPSAPAHFTAPSGPSHLSSGSGHLGPIAGPAPVYGPPSTHNSLLGGPPTKFTHAFEGYSKPSGVQAGFIVLQSLDATPISDSHDTHVEPTGSSPSIVTSAIQALKGILSSGSKSTATAPESTAPAITAPSDSVVDYKDSIYHPPPPVSNIDSFNSYAHQNDVPPFKPLYSSLSDEKKHNGLVTSYGTPITYDGIGHTPNIQTMVDHLAESQLNNLGVVKNGHLFSDYIQSFPNNDIGYHKKRDSENIPGPLNLQELNKITKNIQQRSDNEVPDTSERQSRMDIISELARSMALDELMKSLNINTKKEVVTEKKKSININKSIEYEIRGDKVVPLTENMGNV